MVATAAGLCEFIDASPSPFHVCDTAATRLLAAGFTELREPQSWPWTAGRYFLRRGGSLVAWSTQGVQSDAAFRVVGGHTDSPNLRVKQHPDLRAGDVRVVGLEPYGGAWLNSWLDRDLGISGRVSVRVGAGWETRLVRVDEPLMRVPQLAIHLSEDRKGVALDPQRHVNALWGSSDSPGLLDYVADQLEVPGDSILGWELMTHDLTPSRVIGVDGDFLSAPRLDNQGTCYAGLTAMIEAAEAPGPSVPVLVLFDHEEVGSGSDRGAQSDLLVTVLERIVLARGGNREDYLRAIAGSLCASGDMAHGTHPNYPERHEPNHRIALNGGPVLKVNQNLRYASDADGIAAFALACDVVGVPLQRYVHRADLPCGSTIGPITAARTGITTVDVGAAQLAMHSAREMMGAHDIADYAAALGAFLIG